MSHDPADLGPLPAPGGNLVPPPRHPPTALATATPQPPRLPAFPHEPPALLQLLGRAIDAALDVADDVADTIASATGLRPR